MKPNLSKVGSQAQQLLQTDSVHPEVKQTIRQLLSQTQGQPRTAMMAHLQQPLLQHQDIQPAPTTVVPPGLAYYTADSAAPQSSSSADAAPAAQDFSLFSAAIALRAGDTPYPASSRLALGAAMQTRRQKAKLHELSSFVPRPAVTPDPNTTAGGRHPGAAASNEPEPQQQHRVSWAQPLTSVLNPECTPEQMDQMLLLAFSRLMQWQQPASETAASSKEPISCSMQHAASQPPGPHPLQPPPGRGQ